LIILFVKALMLAATMAILLRVMLVMSRSREPALSRAPAELEAAIAVDVNRYHLLEEARAKRKPAGWLFKTVMFLASVAVFALSFGLVFSWETVLILIGLLLFHELGHLFGMNLFGYRDKQILFIPFLGAVTMGRNVSAKPYQQAAVYLLGPVPGILLGGLLLFLHQESGQSWLRTAGMLALILNYLNLLPIMPLDGGQIVRVVFARRFPRAQVWFMLVSAFSVGLIAASFNDYLLWVLFALLMMMAPYHWQLARLAPMVNQRLSDDQSEDGRLHAIMESLNAPAYSHKTILEKHQMARDLLASQQIDPAGWKLIGAIIGIYLILAWYLVYLTGS
jgi:Zn-dependent protease